ncbi:type I secretion system permease/ATPase [Devosia sp. 2618]|uniref:type I secretion system permease/ATPase n=1 Tax=Devosia sp. 2618 TaxID=3156454 RepID=UPI0033996910
MRNKARSIWAELSVSSNILSALIAVLVFSCFVNILVLTSPIYMMQVYDRVLGSSQVETLLFLSLIALMAYTVFGALDAVRSYVLTRLGSYLDLSLRDPVLTQALAQVSQDSVGARRLVDDLNTMRNYLGSPGVLPFVDAPWVPFFIAVMAMLHPWLGILGIVSAVLLFALAVANDVLTRKYVIAAGQQQSVAGDFATAAIQNAEVVQSMGMQDDISRRYRSYVDDMSSANKRAGDISAILSSASKAIRMIVQSAALGVGAFLVLRAEMSAGGMIGGSILLGRALAPIEQTIGSWRQFISARESYGRVSRFLKNTPASIDRIALPDLKGRLSLEGVFYQIQGADRPVLRNINFAIEPGTALALVGPSASGKSTLCRLAVGAIHPNMGNVRLDGADITSLNPTDARQFIGYMPQNVELFAGTVSDNIARLGAVDDAAVVKAAKIAGCHDMILRLPKGYETELGARGMFLSGGQRQRIGLARALYGSPCLLVLDEPNANLDQEGEKALVDAIRTTKENGASVIVVSHRTTLLQPIDKLAVLRDGMLERFGNRDDILREMQPQAAKPALVQPNEAQSSGGKPT